MSLWKQTFHQVSSDTSLRLKFVFLLIISDWLLSHLCWPFVCLLLRNVYLDPLSSLKANLFSGSVEHFEFLMHFVYSSYIRHI